MPADVPGIDLTAGMGEQNVEEFAWPAPGRRRCGPTRGRGPRAAAQCGRAHRGPGFAAARGRPRLSDRRVRRGSRGRLLRCAGPGVDGWLDDDLAFTRPWGFDPASVATPTFLWRGHRGPHGAAGPREWLAGKVPGIRAHLVPGEGHLSIGVGRLPEILGELAAVCAEAGYLGRHQPSSP